MTNHPFNDVAKSASDLINEGWIVYQKFTCEKCGARQTIDVPNTFYKHGCCEECHHITDIEKRGCNIMVIGGTLNRAPTEEELAVERARSAREVQDRLDKRKEPK